MRRLVYLRVADREVHLPRLIGAFVLAAALLMFMHAMLVMFDSWNTVKFYNKCVEGLSSLQSTQEQRDQFSFCADTLYRSTGMVVRSDSALLSTSQFVGAILGPVASVLFWLAVLLFGYLIYRSGDLELPIEETITEMPDEMLRTPKHTFKKRHK